MKKTKIANATPLSSDQVVTPFPNPAFVGAYVGDIVEACVASILSGQHLIVLGAPGHGKTSIQLAIAKKMGVLTSFTRLEPSTPPEKILGAFDPAALLNGKMVRLTDGTPYANDVRASILDEMFRANEIVFDILLDTTDRIDTDPLTAPVVWANSNFIVQNERTEALVDRFALWTWLNPDTLDVAAMVDAHLSTNNGLDVPYDVPTWDKVQEVRGMMAGPTAKKSISNLLQTLVEEATAQKLRPHPRRLHQWSKLVYRVAAYEHGTADFADLPNKATAILRFAYPAITPDESARWQALASKIGDPIGAAIETVRVNALKLFRDIASIPDAQVRTSRIASMGTFLKDTQTSLKQISATDKRVDETIVQLKQWFAAATLGEMPGSK